ncbi:Protein METABOLIC NETWORK MODULATOR 1 [Linum grandiflorum]
MNPQNQGSGSSAPLDPPQRRKRGRPRKDEHLLPGENMSYVPVSDNMLRNTQSFGSAVAGSSEAAGQVVAGSNMIGQAVSGVVDGKFDAGYLLRVKVGDSENYLRGVVFLPNRVVPVTASNDLAPQAKMYTRADVPIPVLNPPQFQVSVPPPEQSEKQSAEPPKAFKSVEGQGIPSDHQPSSGTCKENQFASVTLPLTDNFRASSSRMMSLQMLDSGSGSGSPANLAPGGKQDELLLEFDASMKKAEAARPDAASSAATTFGILPASSNVNLELQIQHQPNDLDASHCQSVVDGGKTANPELVQPPPVMSEPGSGIMSESADVMGISPEKAAPQEPATNITFTVTDAPPSDLNGILVGNAAEIPQADTTTALVPKSDAEGSSSLEKILESQFSTCSGGMDTMKMDPPTTNSSPMDLLENPAVPKFGNDGGFAACMIVEPQPELCKDDMPPAES